MTRDGGERVNRILDLIMTLASGDLEARAPSSNANDELDAIIVGLNMLGEELLRREQELRAGENARRRASKLEALGILAGGIAHDFNNILQAIGGNAELALLRAGITNQCLEDIIGSTARASELVQQILTFGRVSGAILLPISLPLVVADALAIVRASMPSTVELREYLPPACPSVLGDPNKLTQVVVNLCTNALHAVPSSGGVVEVRLSTPRRWPGSASTAGADELADYVVLSVKDNGDGIPLEVQQKMFDPFFTTKEVGKGTGLGLAVVFGIAQEHRALITVDSEPGNGTAISVSFRKSEPASARVTADETPQPPTQTPECSGRELLIVDDEPTILRLYEQYFETAGYVVSTAESGEKALALFAENPLRFDVVLTDQTMPKMTGVELTRELLARRPTLSVILCSGRQADFMEDDLLAQGVRWFTKPMPLNGIRKLVEECLEPPPPQTPR
jgi:signal transduction histidine kinase